tara:strand:+ start:632 stop:859 length:228 start_codon:yes stop_codon:yes gene_type:complete
MNFLKYFFIIIILFSFNVKANETSKIRYINIDFILKNSIVGKKINKIAIENRDKVFKENKKIEDKLEKQKKRYSF